jgi:hypothetical protein
VNKEIDWHGARITHSVMFKDWDTFSPETKRWAQWHAGRLDSKGAWPKQAECPIGWDERDALV